MPLNAIQLWSPDTCDCVIHLAYDDTIPPEQRTFTAVTEEEAEGIVSARRLLKESGINQNRQPPAKLCLPHAHLGHTPARFQQVTSENQLKNKAFSAAQEVIPELNPRDFKWSFDENRNLKISVPGTSAESKLKLKDKVNKKFGVDKVFIE